MKYLYSKHKINITSLLFFLNFILTGYSQGSGSSLDFDGSNDYVSVGALPALNITANLTVEAWIKPHSSPSWAGIISNLVDNGANENGYGLYYRSTSGRIIFWLHTETSDHNDYSNFPSFAPQNNVWQHVAGTYDGASVKLYVNGVLIGSKAETGNIEYSSLPLDFRLGQSYDNNEEYEFDGEIDEVRVWNVARTEAQIRETMCKKLAGSEIGLVANWRFDDGAGTTLTDIGPNSFNGTLYNMDPATDWQTSGAAIGDESTYSYPITWLGETLDLNSIDKGNFQVNSVSGLPNGVHIYRVDQEPNTTTGIIAPADSNDNYYGVFVTGGTAPSYTVVYDYSTENSATVLSCSSFDLYGRKDNASIPWGSIEASDDAATKKLTKTGNEGIIKEYIFGKLGSLEMYKGPGGVGGSTNNILWLRPDEFSVSDGVNTSFWVDYSGNKNNLSQEVSTLQPIIKNNLINSFDVIRFEVTNRRLRKNNFTGFPTTAISGFYINKNTETSPDGILSYASSSHTNDFLVYNSSDNKINLGVATKTTSAVTNDNQWHLVDFGWKSIGGNLLWYLDGTNKLNSTLDIGGSITAGGTLALAGEQDAIDGSYDSTQAHQGDFAEVILYNTYVNKAERIIVQNYLSAKYNIPIDASVDYFDEDTTGENFDFHVAGIGQADDGTSHLDSQGTGVIRINSPVSVSDGQFLFWGENVKNSSYEFPLNSSYVNRINTKWRVSKTGGLGTVTVQVSACDINLSDKASCSKLYLKVDNNADFSSPEHTYVFTESAGIYTVSGVDFSDNDYFTIEYFNTIVVDNTKAYNGAGAANVPNTTDGCYKLLVKSSADGTPSLTENAHVKEIEVETGGKLVVNTGVELTVSEKINNNGDIKMIGTSQLIQNHLGINTNEGTGNLYIDQQGTNASIYRYNYWSSPVNTGSTTYSVSSVMKDGTSPTSIASNPSDITFTSGYDGSTSPSLTISSYWIYKNLGSWVQILQNGNLDVGMGYTMKGPGVVQNYTFKGKPNSGDYNVAIGAIGEFHLVGNPYPSALDSYDFILHNTTTNNVIDGTIYFWEHNGEEVATDGHNGKGYLGGYAARSLLISTVATAPVGYSVGGGSGVAPGRYIPVGQGFMVISTAMGDVQFKNDQRNFKVEGADSHFYKSTSVNEEEPNSEVPIIRLQMDYQTNYNQIMQRQLVLGFKEGMSDDFDKGYDSNIIDIHETDWYWHFKNDDKKYIIACVGKFKKNKRIPVSFVLDKNQSIKLHTVEKMNLTDVAYLYDKLTGKFYDLSSDVSLELAEGIYDNRFEVTFNKVSENESNSKERIIDEFEVHVNREQNKLSVNSMSDHEILSITIHTISGKTIMDVQLETYMKDYELTLPKLAKGVYIISINKNMFNKYSKKIAITK